jgi:hydrogenase/urease accessory protein HupE
MKRLLLTFSLCLWGAILAFAAQAHEIRPSYLELRQTAADTYELLFKIPALTAETRPALMVKLPEGTQDVGTPRASFTGGAYIEQRTIKRQDGLLSQSIAIDGLAGISAGVLVRVEELDGAVQTERLTAANPSFVVVAAPGFVDVALTYFWIGVEHILFGFDHLLFVLALVILVRDFHRIALTVTAFTLAHSITLALATLGYVHVPGPPVEATIALSIMLVAIEIVNARHGRPSLTARWPWLVAFSFGLLHGLGFAGALSEVGLPENAIPLALLFFNVGVEAGQISFVAVVLLVSWAAASAWRRVEPGSAERAFARVDVAAAYGIGAMAAFWTIDRVIGFWGAA